MGKVRVLQILAGGNEYNGVSDFLLSHYAYMDRDAVQFDFVFCRSNTMKLRQQEDFLADSKFIELNTDLTKKANHPMELVNKVRDVVQREKPDIVHINTGSISITARCLLGAKRGGADRIISHSHNTDPLTISSNPLKKNVKKIANNLMRYYIRRNSTLILACSDEAGEYLCGKQVLKSKKYSLAKNAIHTDAFLYNGAARERLRREFQIGPDTTLFGCVGRFSRQKNHLFLIDVFHQYQKKHPDSLLWLVGEGDTREAVQRKVNELGLTEKVVFLGQRKDVNELLQAMDVFVLTSIYEGLGIVSIEAQASGLPVFLPDEISHGSDISPLAHFIPLSAGADFWAESIGKVLGQQGVRQNMRNTIVESGYDISKAAKRLEKIYIKLGR